jgi:hypothetical protein
MERLTPPKQVTFFISVAIVIISVVLSFLSYKAMNPFFHNGAYLMLLIGYLVLLAGNLLEGL